jgi:hypothetical protein
VGGLFMVQVALLASYVLGSWLDGWFLFRGQFLLIALLSVINAVLFHVGFLVCTRKYNMVLDKHAYLICPDCGYVLVGLPPEHSCPECGTPYSHDRIRDQWIVWSAGSKKGMK